MAKCSSVALCVVIAAQLALLAWVLRATSVMRQEWPRVVKAKPAEVYAVQLEPFWGPVNAIVPRQCREMERWQELASSPGDLDIKLAMHVLRREEMPSRKNSTTSDEKKEDTTFLAKAASAGQPPKVVTEKQLRKLAAYNTLEIQRCNETMSFQTTSRLHRYLSMISLSDVITGGTPTAEELHSARIKTHNSLIVGIGICMLLKYALKLTDVLASYSGYRYKQLWNQGRTTLDKALESLMIHGISILFTLAMQITVCTLFLTFWREDHFVMTYVPGLAFIMFFLSLVIFTVAMVIDRVLGLMVRFGDWYIYLFWMVWLLWVALLVVPMIGYCIYSANFMWEISRLGWLQDEAHMFSEEFVEASVSASFATACFMGIALIDLVVILILDLDRC